MRRWLLVGAIGAILFVSCNKVAGSEERYIYRPIEQQAFVQITPMPIPDVTMHPAPPLQTDPPIRPMTAPIIIIKPVDPVKPHVVSLPVGGRKGSGTATWYCNYTDATVTASVCPAKFPDVSGIQYYAAAGPVTRLLFGHSDADWRGHSVYVTSKAGFTIRVKLVDWCACGGDHVIDLFHDAFAELEKHGKVNPVKVTPIK